MRFDCPSSLFVPCSLACLGLLACSETIVSQKSPPLITANTDVLDFGRIPIGANTRRRVQLLNSGGTTLTIARVLVRPEGEAFIGFEAPRSIAPRSQVDIDIGFTPLEARRYAAELAIASNAENDTELTVGLFGEGVSGGTCGTSCPEPISDSAPDASLPSGGDAGGPDGAPSAIDAGIAGDSSFNVDAASPPDARDAPGDAEAASDRGASLPDAGIPGSCGLAEGSLKWSYPAAGPGLGAIFSSPAIGSDGTIYAGTGNGRLLAIHPDGTLRFSYDTGTGELIASTPAIDATGTIYFGSYDDNLYAIDGNGALRWTFATGGDVNSSPALAPDGTIYVGSADGRLYAVTPFGVPAWSFDAGAYVYSSPAIAPNGVIYFGTKYPGSLVALNPNGTLRWSHSIGSDVDSSPAIGTDGTIYVGADDGNLYAIDSTGGLRWAHSTGGGFLGIDSSPAIGTDGTIYVGSWNDVVDAVSPAGALLWSYPTGATVGWSSPAIGRDQTIFVGLKDAHQIGAPNALIALWPDGSLRWSLPTPAFIDTSPALADDGTLYFGAWDGKIYAVCTDSPGPARTPWPKFHRDAHNTGRLPACRIEISVQCGAAPGSPATYMIDVRDADPGVIVFSDPTQGQTTSSCATGVGPIQTPASNGVIHASYALGPCPAASYLSDNACSASTSYTCP